MALACCPRPSRELSSSNLTRPLNRKSIASGTSVTNFERDCYECIALASLMLYEINIAGRLFGEKELILFWFRNHGNQEVTADEKERAALIIQDYGGILPYHEAFYIASIIYSAERADAAFRRFERTLQNSEETSQTMAAVQEALTYAGALSRFFWPMNSKNEIAVSRGQKLREAFELHDTSALRNRELRNAFEHFDERLDGYLTQDHVGYFFPAAKVDDHALADDKIGHIFKLVDPKEGICVILGQKFEFWPIKAEVQRILSLALQMDENGARLPHKPTA